MADEIKFEDGAGYETMMGGWSRLVGDVFLDWLAPPRGKSWIDVGCGNGAFTQVVVERCAPSDILGIDPSEGQIAYARQRPAGKTARFEIGDAMALPLGDGSVDIAVAALVIFFMPDPQKGVAEMARVVRPGGIVCTYAWDLLGGGFPYNPVQTEMRAAGRPPLLPPHPEAANTDELRRLWSEAGLTGIETREIVVQREFDGFEDYWSAATSSGGTGPVLSAMPADARAALKARVRAAMGGTDGPFRPSGRAHAIKGVMPA